ncbi:ABC transporter ATP-binding protein [Bacillus wiedmannii]|uniref:ABC transporter ATP-binding protein n=1 Tax=Bacillus wiedmannii TaxID=1890302 RepID=UPI000BF839FF|nr:ABC transporter ATP-binding protein [Bacillus wiedmannii]PGD97832.1 ABC transporter ATP-binding protein [Bacillus wiedmannii]PHG78281.1 ABC transporter ATP-binding protein [Bacillus wiedmannii]
MINVNNLYFTYPGQEKKTIKGMSFSINHGEIFGFLGPSGAGKSTVQKIIIGILKRYSGNVNVLGNEIRDSNSDIYEKIGVSFELPNLYIKFSALENLNFFRSFYRGETEEPMRLLEMVGLEKYANNKVSSFSKGMKMRLNFARSLLNKPDLIFLDEPTSGLDPVNSKRITEIILQKKREGKTIFLTTHNMSVAEEICDRVAFVVDGKINLIDSPRELKLKYGKKNLRIEYQSDNENKISEFDLDNIGENKEFIYLIQNNKIVRMHTQEATLQDIFIEVTGRSLL